QVLLTAINSWWEMYWNGLKMLVCGALIRIDIPEMSLQINCCRSNPRFSECEQTKVVYKSFRTMLPQQEELESSLFDYLLIEAVYRSTPGWHRGGREWRYVDVRNSLVMEGSVFLKTAVIAASLVLVVMKYIKSGMITVTWQPTICLEGEKQGYGWEHVRV
ncbi:hypothetical protein FRX31_028535, partial [Thalictrum thalictroides]